MKSFMKKKQLDIEWTTRVDTSLNEITNQPTNQPIKL